MDEPQDGATLNDTFELSNLVSWLRRSTREQACVLVSETQDGKTVAPIDQIRHEVNGKAIVVRLPNRLQPAAYRMLGTVNPFHGAARIFPPGDAWADDYKLVPYVRPQLSRGEFLRELARRLAATGKPRSEHAKPEATPVREVSLADVRVRDDAKWYLIDAGHAGECVRSILSPERIVPVILVSKAAGHAKPYVNMESLVERVGDGAIVFEIADGAADEALNERLPKWARTTQGSVRFMSFDSADTRGQGSKLYRIHSAAGSKRLIEQLADDTAEDLASSEYDQYDDQPADTTAAPNAEHEDNDKPADTIQETAPADGDMWQKAANADTTAPPPPSPDMVEAHVEMLLDGVAYVKTADEAMPRKADTSALAQQLALTFTDIDYRPQPDAERATPADWILRRGQKVRGIMEGADAFRPAADWTPPARALEPYTAGTVVCGIVSHVLDDRFTLVLYPPLGGNPAVETIVNRADLLAGTPIPDDTDLRPVLHKGEPIALKIVLHEQDADPSSEWLFTLPTRQDAATMLQPPSLLPDGPGWIHTTTRKDGNGADPFDYLTRLQGTQPLSNVPFDQLVESTGTLETAHDTMHTLYSQLADAQRKADRLEHDNQRLTEQNLDLKRHNRNVAKALDETNPVTIFEGHFTTLQDELDWMIQAQAILQIPAAERARRPLDEWSYAPGFLDTLRECEHGDMSRTSLLRTIVFVLMGNEANQKGLRQHRLREGRGGDDASRLDMQGNIILRVDVHGQYRLHYTRDTANHITLLSVTTHDAILF